MNAILAIIHETWRQSRQQVVFIILIVVAVVMTGLGIGLVSLGEREGDSRPHFDTVLSILHEDQLAEGYVTSYAGGMLLAERKPSDHRDGPIINVSRAAEQRAEAELANANVSKFEQAGRMYSSGFLSTLLTLLMLGFIAVCSPYFPDLLSSGAVDVVVAKPVARWQLYLGKMLGGLALITALLVAAQLIFFLGIGIRMGFWDLGLVRSIPATVFIAAVLYAFVGTIGVMWRSSTLAIILGYVYYVVIDTGLGALTQIQQFGAFNEYPTWDSLIAGVRYAFPNFSHLKSVAAESVLLLPFTDYSQFLTGSVWLLILLALGIWKFERSDF